MLLGAKDLIELDIADPNSIAQVNSRIDRLKLIQKRLNLIRDLDDIQLRSRILRVEFELTHWGVRNVNKYYVKVFGDNQLDVEQPPQAAIKRLSQVDPRTREELIIALNHWFITIKKEQDIYWPWLCEVLDAVDADEWRLSLRTAIESGDRNLEAEALRNVDVKSQDTRIIAALCFCDGTLNRERDGVIAAAYDVHPTDFWINHTIALKATFISTKMVCSFADWCTPCVLDRSLAESCRSR